MDVDIFSKFGQSWRNLTQDETIVTYNLHQR